ncbi:MAG: hypothetical protein RL721_1895 [Candidatus Eisenbacteria bacterium]
MPAREGCACNPPASVILREGRGSRRQDPEKAPPPGMGSGGGSVCAADSGVRRARHRSRPGGRSDRAPRPKPGLLATHRCPNGTPAGGTPAPEPLTGLCSRSRREPSLHPTGENLAPTFGVLRSRGSKPAGRRGDTLSCDGARTLDRPLRTGWLRRTARRSPAVTTSCEVLLRLPLLWWRSPLRRTSFAWPVPVVTRTRETL